MAKKRAGTKKSETKDTGGEDVVLQPPSTSLLLHPADDEIDGGPELNLLAASRMPPDGKASGTLSTRVTDQHGRPVQGVLVSYTLTFVNPGGDWRSASGMKRLYDQKRGNGNKAKRLVERGVIRLIGSLSASSARTDKDGIARVTYTTSHLASDFTQSRQAKERITSTLPNGKKDTTDILIGWTGLKTISPTAGGLRVVGATGKHVHPDLRTYLSNLGKAVKKAGWPHPVTVTAASLRWGGQYPPHFTHKHGLTLDLRPMSTDGEPTWAKADGSAKKNYDSDRTKALIATLKDSGGTVYFNGKGAGGQQKVGHDNHIHVSWLTSRILKSPSVSL